MHRWPFALCAWSLLCAHSLAATLEAGPGKPFPLPSQAIAKAQAGDVVRIAPGRYVDCAVIRQDRLVIEGTGPGVALADKACAGKAILVVAGRDVTVRGLTLSGARVPDRNGAGIRAEGGTLTVEDVTFIDNENGLMTSAMPGASVLVSGSTFIRNGHCDPACTHGIYAGAIGLLRVERSRFVDTRIGHHIKSRAARTELIGNDIADGETGTSSFLIDIPNGGNVLIERNILQKGPRSSNAGTVIMIGAEGVTNPTDEIRVIGNHLTSNQVVSTVFVNNRTTTPARLEANILNGPIQPLAGPGTIRSR